MKNIRMIVGGVEVRGQLDDSELAAKVWRLMPWESWGETWGEEVYFPVRLQVENTDPRETVEVGDIAYWPEGPDICLFFGPTPKSKGQEPVVASPATVIGKFEAHHADFRTFQRERRGILVRVERAGDKPAAPEPAPAEEPAPATEDTGQ